MDSAESIRAWRENHIIDRGAQIEGIEEIESLTIETLNSAMPEGGDPKDVVNRLKDLERKLYAQITAAKEHLSKAQGREAVSQTSAAPEGIPRNHQAAARCTLLVAANGDSPGAKQPKSYISTKMMPLVQLVKMLPNQGQSDNDRQVLAHAAKWLLTEMAALSQRVKDACCES